MINNLYYGSDNADIDRFRNASFKFDTDVLATFLRRIYNGFDTSNDVEPTMWREILRIINEATVDGLVQGNYDTNIDKTFLEKLAHSNEVFSAFKVHDMGVDMAKKMRTDEGKLKPFSEWKKDIKSIASHYCGAWLQTEYSTATLRAKFAAEWKQYEADADIMPNLRWMPTTSANPEEEHKEYWMNRLTLPVGDKFWDKHHPGDHWNCKCSLEQTDEPANPDVLSHIPDVKPQKGLAANPGKTGEMFDKEHPYFPKDCAHCFLRKGGKISNMFNNEGKHCMSCQYANGCTERAKELSAYVEEKKKKENVELSVEEKEAIYAMPIEQQYTDEGKFRKGHVFKHVLENKYIEDDYDRVFHAASLFADSIGDAKINPRVSENSIVGRKTIYPGIVSKATPDLFVEGIGYIDVKSPKRRDKIVKNANHASNEQEAYACITDHEYKDGEISLEFAREKSNKIFDNEKYHHDKVFWVIKGKLYTYYRPKK